MYTIVMLRQLINGVYTHTHTQQWDQPCQISRDVCTLLNQDAVLSNPALSVHYITYEPFWSLTAGSSTPDFV